MVLMEHPPKQGLKHKERFEAVSEFLSFNGTSTKTRIETTQNVYKKTKKNRFNGTSTKTRIETIQAAVVSCDNAVVLMEHPPKQGLKRSKLSTIWFESIMF